MSVVATASIATAEIGEIGAPAVSRPGARAKCPGSTCGWCGRACAAAAPPPAPVKGQHGLRAADASVHCSKAMLCCGARERKEKPKKYMNVPLTHSQTHHTVRHI